MLRSGLFAPGPLLALAGAVMRSGINLVALVRLGARIRADAAIEDGRERVAFGVLADQAERIAAMLHAGHGVGRGTAVAITGANGLGFVRALLALSRLGARAVLINPALPPLQASQLLDRHGVSLLLAAKDTVEAMDGVATLDPDDLLRSGGRPPVAPPRQSSGEIVVLTGGTTGLPKPAGRAVAPGSVLRLFLHLVAALQLERRRAVFVAVPLFHGFGLASLIVALALGRTVHLRPRFEAGPAAALIGAERIDTLVVVPTMLRRLLAVPDALGPLQCVVSGGAALDAELVQDTRARLGEILFNLYGTSEAGLAALALPDDLAAAPGTIGRPIWGAQIRLGDEGGSADEGALWVRSAASITRESWIATGDLAHRDAAGRLFIRGQTDDMIVSGGENVDPWELETVLLTHPHVAQAAAVGVADRDYGQRLVAFVVPHSGFDLDADMLLGWLAGRVARHLTPRSVAVRDALPLTAIGKVDRTGLRQAAMSGPC
ncbi:AMP-binding protein [Sphingomonas sp. HF-S3]|uniref:AMP-binding protein n=1 Tax=Sphingomonas rustica TaxID=3103142 RepID=A0ABV0BEK3_9SPHN